MIKCNVVNAVPFDLLPGHPLTVNQFHSISLVYLEEMCIRDSYKEDSDE